MGDKTGSGEHRKFDFLSAELFHCYSPTACLKLGLLGCSLLIFFAYFPSHAHVMCFI